MADNNKKNPTEASNIFHSIIKASVTKNSKINSQKSMANKFEHKGHEYWVTVTEAIHPETKEGVFVAFVRNEEPKGLLYGKQVNNPDGKPMFFANEHSALTNANAVVQAEIDSQSEQ